MRNPLAIASRNLALTDWEGVSHMTQKNLSSLLDEKNQEILCAAHQWKESSKDIIENPIPIKKRARRRKKIINQQINPSAAPVNNDLLLPSEVQTANHTLEYYLQGHMQAMWNPDEDYVDN